MGSIQIKERDLFQPNIMNDASKEPQGWDEDSTSSAKSYGWFWPSVEVHIQNSENNSK